MPPPSSTAAQHLFSPESLTAAGRAAERLSLPALQSKMKCDPEGYEAELLVLLRHFDSSLDLFRQQSALNPSSDPAVAKELGDLSLFLAHVTPFYPDKLADFPFQVAELLRSSARSLPSSLRVHLVQALILLVNRKIVDLDDTLELFMELQILGDRPVRKLAFSHVVHSIRRMNQKHKNEAENRKLQNMLFTMLQGEEELRAKRSLVILCDLHRRRVWFDDRTANAICTACFHPSSKIVTASLSFLLGYEQVEEENDSEASSSEDEASEEPYVILSKEDVYKAHRKGTTASKKKKKAKLQRVIRSMKRQQRRASENNSTSYYSPLTYLKDPQGFAEKLFSGLQKCHERFEVRMMMLKVISRTVGLHRLILLNLYPFLQRYVQPHQRDVTTLLAAAVQTCHDMVPPDAVEPLFKQIVNQFVHDHSRPEAIAVGLNAVREICLRMPLLMNEDLLQDLVLYKKSHEKAVSTAARSLITLFREICPSLLVKKDRGRPTNPKAKPKAYGEVTVATNIPGLELLQDTDLSATSGSDECDENDSADDTSLPSALATYDESDDKEVEEDDDFDNVSDGNEVEDDLDEDENDGQSDDEDVEEDYEESTGSLEDSENDHPHREDDKSDHSTEDKSPKKEMSGAQKRKFSDYSGQINAANASLRALKKLAGAKTTQTSAHEADAILSNEDFRQIKAIKARKEAKLALAQQGLMNRRNSDSKQATFSVPSSDQLSRKRVDPAVLEVNIRRKLSKEERLALVIAGREDRTKYQARTAVKQKKTGGSSNRQKEHKKRMPLAAKRAKARSRQEKKKKKQKRSGKQFVGRKAWK